MLLFVSYVGLVVGSDGDSDSCCQISLDDTDNDINDMVLVILKPRSLTAALRTIVPSMVEELRTGESALPLYRSVEYKKRVEVL